MIINNSRRFLFIHVPKAAGTSVTRELSRFTTFRDVEVGGTRYGEKIQDMYAARFDLRKHSTAKLIRAKAGPEVWRGFFVFAFVRDPYARAYSLFRFIQKWREGPHHAEIDGMTFEGFVTSPALAEGRIDIAQPQTHWLADAEGRVMDGLDFVGRLETFDADMSFILSTIQRRICDYRGVDRANVSAEPEEWREAMTPAAAHAIRTIYAEDFRLFGYSTEEVAAAA